MSRSSTTIGIVGLGDMGLLYARTFSNAGWTVVACDREDLYPDVAARHRHDSFAVLPSGHDVARIADYTIYSVETENIAAIVAKYGPSTKYGAIAGGQCSCKAPEIAAFEAHLPKDVRIVSLHSLHGPKVDSRGNPLVIVPHRSNQEAIDLVESLVSCFHSKVVHLSAEDHDKITADTQAVTHAAFLSMGLAWRCVLEYPWETLRWMGGLENAKINISLRIYSNKWHVYAGLAITNPAAHAQILQYALLTSDLFTLMITGQRQQLYERLLTAKKLVFARVNPEDLLLDDRLLQQFSLSNVPPGGRAPNLHLSLLAIVDSWHTLGLCPYDHIICSTPLFRIFLGVTEYVFCTPGLLEECVDVAVTDPTFRHDDLEFTINARNWLKVVSFSNYDLYQQEFEKTQKFFEPMFAEATKVGNEMIHIIQERVNAREAASNSRNGSGEVLPKQDQNGLASASKSLLVDKVCVAIADSQI